MTSRLVPIPEWDPTGFLPLFLDSPVLGEDCSPYSVRLTDLVLRFGDTSVRRNLLNGLLDYRATLHGAGLRDGFQWVNGSFVEDTTQHGRGEPNDIDVVTFFRIPGEQTQGHFAQNNRSLFDQEANRRRYGVDAYPVVLDASDLSHLVRMTTYWSSLWSHDRAYQRKGYLEIELSDSEDAAARAVLDQATANEVGE